MILQEGKQAIDFTLSDENEKVHKLSDYQGKYVLLYFYPKDNTKGCTTEACNFRDDYSAYREAGVVILGVSPDSTKSHKNFIDKFLLPFTLLADPNHKVCDLYGVWGRKKFMGREYDGVFRTTFLINPDGKIVKVFENVKPGQHSKEVLEVINSLKE
ncbi:MAG: thioredoxin-dependent thiol peroxidase [Anaerolineales bacterium]|nr:thioredoxin-dependent thiol peroxidase [Anaerolineales bacterium]